MVRTWGRWLVSERDGVSLLEDADALETVVMAAQQCACVTELDT